MKIARCALPLLALPFLLMLSCQHKLIYFPRPYPANYHADWQLPRPSSKVITYNTSAGKQTAFLMMPGSNAQPEHLWLVCCGNGTLAAEWTPWIETGSTTRDAYLLLDYPSYGSCEGRATPERIRESISTALPMAATICGMTTDDLKLHGRFLGHSLGCAAALQGACDFSLPQGVLISPFTSTMDMAKEVIGLPLGWMVTHRFDNRARIRQWAAQGGKHIDIFHGDDDPVIPLAMSQQLRAIAEEKIDLTIVAGGGHDALVRIKRAEIQQCMRRATPTSPASK